jgi:pyruvate-formate lyase-activating enzyme
MAGEDGQLYDHPELLMLCRKGRELALPRPDELIPLPPESELFLLERRHAVGLNPDTGELEVMEEPAVAAFISPGHTVCGTSVYQSEEDADVLPLFAYGAVGFADDTFWVCARKVDQDRRQIFANIDPKRIRQGATNWMKRFPKNRLVRHLAGCALTYGCPAAKNMALGRFECPLPTARTCNAACVGCISLQPEDSGFPSTQERIAFAPDPGEISEIMLAHGKKAKNPIYSFGQGCEGEPLTEAKAIAESIAAFRAGGGQGTVNINTNASLPQTMEPLAEAGLDSIRCSLNSARPETYARYYRPKGYGFDDVVRTITLAKERGIFVSLNLLFFPGFTDTEAETEALGDLIEHHHVDFVQLRNLNLDPELYLDLMDGVETGPVMGLTNFRKRLKKRAPRLEFGYFNPYLGKKKT